MNLKFCGQTVSEQQISEIQEIISTFPLISRTELANTISELFSWRRPTGKLKTVECRQFLEQLNNAGVIHLPALKTQYRKKSSAPAFRLIQTKIPEHFVEATLSELMPIFLEHVVTKQQRHLWNSYIEQFHYMGFATPFGACLRYFIQSASLDNPKTLGCFQFSSPAWRIEARDKWIGWDDRHRQINLQKIVNNSRFLIFPWVKVKNLASHVLALAARQISEDWKKSYGYAPVLIETMVDETRFGGTCYTAANWTYIGRTKGRGRMDRENRGKKVPIKKMFAYPLVSNFREALGVKSKASGVRS